MYRAYLLTGSNMGNRLAFLGQAVQYIEQDCGTIVQQSAIYETAPWGLKDQASFLNQALLLETSLSPALLMQQLLHIETRMGRIRTVKLGPRIIDLDILLIDSIIMSSDILELPHPALPARRFALLPLCEIAPQIVHPILKLTMFNLLEICTDDSDVQKKIG
jgi:2-amino-4-hydroxy-6-hydroxymethyldihydropteridine diphosphokinase